MSETHEERLERIEGYLWDEGIPPTDLDWLIAQAHKVQLLEATIDMGIEKCDILLQKLSALSTRYILVKEGLSQRWLSSLWQRLPSRDR